VGGVEPLPGGQITRVPNTGSAIGVVIIDRTIGAHDYRELTEPIELQVRKRRRH